MLVAAFARRGAGLDAIRLILCGVSLSALFSAIVTLVLTRAGADYAAQILAWLAGSTAGRGWHDLFFTLPYAALGLGFALAAVPALNVLRLGESRATAVGVNVARTQWVILIAASLLAASAVAVSGSIGFVGLVVPHLARRVVGGDARALLPASAMRGAALCCRGCRQPFDAAPAELPVGVLLAFVGVRRSVSLPQHAKAAGRGRASRSAIGIRATPDARHGGVHRGRTFVAILRASGVKSSAPARAGCVAADERRGPLGDADPAAFSPLARVGSRSCRGGTPLEERRRDVVASGRYPFHRWWEWAAARRLVSIDGALDAVGMGGFADRALGALSSGERQRIWIALALARKRRSCAGRTDLASVRVAHEILALLRAQAKAGRTIVCAMRHQRRATYADALMLPATNACSPSRARTRLHRGVARTGLRHPDGDRARRIGRAAGVRYRKCIRRRSWLITQPDRPRYGPLSIRIRNASSVKPR